MVDAPAINTAAGQGASAIQNNYPVQKNGLWMAMASVVGSITGRLYSSGTLDRAKDAEKIWRQLTDALRDKGQDVFGSSGTPQDYADDILKALHDFAKEGYCPDYLSILSTAVQAASIQFDTQMGAMKRQAGRFNTGLNANVELEVRMQKAAAVVLAYATSAESARQFMWSANYDMFHGTAETFENIKNQRIELGADLIASAGQNYANLAQSLRQTAAMDSGGVEAIISVLGTLIPMFLTSDSMNSAFGFLGL